MIKTSTLTCVPNVSAKLIVAATLQSEKWLVCQLGFHFSILTTSVVGKNKFIEKEPELISHH